ELVTCPRFLGVGFNPLNTYYVYSPGGGGALRAVLLEVNNTFGERHLYLCDARDRRDDLMRPGYDAAFLVRRAFHVSPFNNRSGAYEANVVSPRRAGRVDVGLIIRDYQAACEDIAAAPTEKAALELDKQKRAAGGQSRPKGKHLIARLRADPYPLNTMCMLHLLLLFPITLLTTIPRTFFQAWILAYSKRVPLYQRPNAFRSVSEQGLTVMSKPLDSFQTKCQSALLQHLQSQIDLHGSFKLDLILPDGSTQALRPTRDKHPQSDLPATIRLTSGQLGLRLVADSDVARALAVAFVRGDWTAPSVNAAAAFLLLIAATPAATAAPPPPPPPPGLLLRLARGLYVRGTPPIAALAGALPLASPTVTSMAPTAIAAGVVAAAVEERL
ncbi:hypothetical protein HK405_001414, partial [Cladochytrium tenue]